MGDAGDGPESATLAGSVYSLVGSTSAPVGGDSAMPAGSPRLIDTKHLGFGLSKLEI
jgi:hypothetical protein